MHQITSYDLASPGAPVLEFVPTQVPTTTPATTTRATTQPTSRAGTTSATTKPTNRAITTRGTTRSTSRATTQTRSALVGPVLDSDGGWLLPAVDVPIGPNTVLEDLIWFRFEGDDFGRSYGWNGRVVLVAYDGGGPRVAVRCSSTRVDGAVEVHDGREWRQTGVLLRGGVDYLIRTIIRAGEGQADVYLLESARPMSRPSVRSTASAATRAGTQPATRASTQPTTRAGTQPATAPTSSPIEPASSRSPVQPGLSTARQISIATSVPMPEFGRSALRRVFGVSGGPRFRTVLRRWQLWDVTRPPRTVAIDSENRTAVDLAVGDAPEVSGSVQLRRDPNGVGSATFQRQVGLEDDFRNVVGWSDGTGDRLASEQGGPVLVVRDLGSHGAAVRRPLFPPRVPFDLRVVFKIPTDAPPMRTVNLVRMIREETDTTIGPYVQLFLAEQDLGKGNWAGRLAAQVGKPKPVIDGNPINMDTWYEVRLAVDPIAGTYRGFLTTLGTDRPVCLYRPTTGPASAPTSDRKVAKTSPSGAKPVAMFGGAVQKFFGLARLPREVSLSVSAQGAYRRFGKPVELDARPSFVLPLPDSTRPWVNPATLTDMTYRAGRLEILDTHGGASLLTLDLADGTLEFAEKVFGKKAGQALAWDQHAGCYWWVQPDGRHLLEQRRPERPDAGMFSSRATTQPVRRFDVPRTPERITVDGELGEWRGAAARGPLSSDPAQVGQRDCTFMAMYDAAGLCLAADVHDPDPPANIATPSIKDLAVGDLVTFRLAFGPGPSTSVAATTQSESSDNGVSLHFWHNPKQKQSYVARRSGSSKAATAATTQPSDIDGIEMQITPWPAKDPRGKGYTLEAAVPWRCLATTEMPKPGQAARFSASYVWGDAAGAKAIASVTAFGLGGLAHKPDPNHPLVSIGSAVFLPEGRPSSSQRGQVVSLHPNGRLAATSKDLFLVTWDKDVYRLPGKAGPATAFAYRTAFDAKLKFAGVAADENTLLLAGPYGAPNAGIVTAVDLASGQPIRSFSLRRYVKGITSLATDGKQLYALAANDRTVLSCDWPGPRLLGLTSPVLMVGRIDVLPTDPTDELVIIPPSAKAPKLGGSVSVVKDAAKGANRFKVQKAQVDFPAPTLVVGDTLGQLRTIRLRLRPIGPAQVLRISLGPKPVGKPRCVSVAVLDEKSASRWPLPNRRTTAGTFFGGDEFVRDAKSPLRAFKPARDDEPVLVLPAGKESVDVVLDLVEDFALPVDTWIGRIQLQSIGPRCEIERLSVNAVEAMIAGPTEGVLTGDVIDLRRAGAELIDWQSDLDPAGRSGDELRLAVRSADDRADLERADWRPVFDPSGDRRSATSNPTTATGRQPRRLRRFVQWRLVMSSVNVHQPPKVSSVRLILAGVSQPIAGDDDQAGSARSWRTWWPVIFAVPVVCYLIWFAFLRRTPRRDGRKQTDR